MSFQSLVVVVGQFLTAASVSVVPECLPDAVEYPAAPEAFASVVVVVGQPREEEESFAAVRSPDSFCGEHIPRRIVPERGKVSEDAIETSTDECGDVFDEDERWTDLVDDADVLGPEPGACSWCDARTFSSHADVLAGEAADNPMYTATPWSAIEAGYTVPNRSWCQRRVCHPRHENGRCVGFPLDVHHRAMCTSLTIESQPQSQIEPCDSSEEGNRTDFGTYSHNA